MKRFAEHLALGNSMPRARHCYHRDLRLVQEYFNADPATLTEDQFRGYILYVRIKKMWEPKTIRQTAASAKRFFVDMLGYNHWTVFSQIHAKDHEKLPAVLTRDEVRRLLGYPRPHHRRPRMFPRSSSGQFSQQGDDESIRCVGEGGLHILTQCHERGSCGGEGNAHVHARLHDHQRHETGAADEAQGHGAGIHQRSLQPQCVDFGNVPRRGCLKILAAANNDRQARLGANPGGQREGDGIRYRCRSQLGTASGRLRWSI